MSGWREERMIPLLPDADEHRSAKSRTRTKQNCTTYDKLTLLPDSSIKAKTPKISSSISRDDGPNNDDAKKASYAEWNAELLTIAEDSLETSLLQQSRSLSPTSCHVRDRSKDKRRFCRNYPTAAPTMDGYSFPNSEQQ
uniref:Uncharacterized protein n=1 Tax=Ascaris lumbricoides TaxID=6252 RepID=A0A0M3HTM7_ASCLU